jgi:hypothetical protein
MLELIELVNVYTNGGMTYREFRREFVLRFLSVRSGDVTVDNTVAEIESLCADVAEKLIQSETELKAQLQSLIQETFVKARILAAGALYISAYYSGSRFMLPQGVLPDFPVIQKECEKEFA